MVARIYYHLQEYNESMVFALGAGKLFDLDRGGEFEETIIGKLGEACAIAALERPFSESSRERRATADCPGGS